MLLNEKDDLNGRNRSFGSVSIISKKELARSSPETNMTQPRECWLARLIDLLHQSRNITLIVPDGKYYVPR